MKLWTVQNGHFLWSMMQNEYYENHHLNSKLNYFRCIYSTIIKFGK